MKIYTIETWSCPECEYNQDFDPNNQEMMSKIFAGVEIGSCPACFMGKNPERQQKNIKMSKQTDKNKKTKVRVPSDDEIDADNSVEDKEKAKKKAKDDSKKWKEKAEDIIQE